MQHGVLVFALVSILIAGDAGAWSPAGAGAVVAAQDPAPDMVERSGLRNVRYCEVFVVTGILTRIEGRVYNTLGLNDCPADQWAALDPDALKGQFNARDIILNGPRYWLMDRLTSASPSGVATFGGLDMNLVAVLHLPLGSLLGGGRRSPYTENTVDRDTQWVFSPGRLGYELGDGE
jgi:haloalkane dehalogenase